MKIIITSDFHIQENRLEDISSVMDQIANFGIEKTVDWLWFLGDLFHQKKPTPMCQMVANKWVKKITDNNIKLLILIGNHDQSFNISSVHYLNTLKVPNVLVRKSPYIFGNKYYLAHQGLKEAKLGVQNFNLENELSANEILLKNPNLHGYFFGHIHKAQRILRKPLVIFPGSPERMDFGERNEGKGFLYLENTQIKFMPLKTRPMVQLDLTPENLTVPALPEGAIIKIVFTGKKSEIKSIDEKNIIRQIPKPKSIKIVYNPIRETSVRSKIINETATPAMCFMEYARLRNFDQETIEQGKQIIN